MNTDQSRTPDQPDFDELEAGSDETAVENLLEDLEVLSHSLDTANAQKTIRETQELLVSARERGLIDSGVRSLDVRDGAEAFIGSIIFASPLLVEDGVFDIAQHLFRTTYVGIPVFLLTNVLFVVLLTYALLEWTGRDKTEANKIFGYVPTRLLMILTVSFVVSAVLMTVWGRVENWQPVSEAVARVTVLWTVGSIGAALGDILSHEEDTEPMFSVNESAPIAASFVSDTQDNLGELSDSELLAEIETNYDTLEDIIKNGEKTEGIEQMKERTQQATTDALFGKQIKKYTTRDVAEAFVGSIVFAIPLLVEDGVFDVADYFLSFQIMQFPVFFLFNAIFVLFIVWALIYWTGPQDVQINRPIFGIFPRRVVGIAIISFITAAALMTMWGRVDHWADPVVAIARISAVWSVAAFGAALGDILPGESSGADINDEIAEFTDYVGGSRQTATNAEQRR